MTRRAVGQVGLVMLCACVQTLPELAQTSSGFVGCAAADITVTNETHSDWTHRTTWEATCHGRTFVCAQDASLSHKLDVACTPHVQTAAAPSLPAVPPAPPRFGSTLLDESAAHTLPTTPSPGP